MDKKFSFIGLISLLLYAISTLSLLGGVFILFEVSSGEGVLSFSLKNYYAAMIIGIISNPKTLKFIKNTLFK